MNDNTGWCSLQIAHAPLICSAATLFKLYHTLSTLFMTVNM